MIIDLPYHSRPMDTDTATQEEFECRYEMFTSIISILEDPDYNHNEEYLAELYLQFNQLKKIMEK